MSEEINVIDCLKEADGGYAIIEARDDAGEGWVNIMKITGEVLTIEKGICPNIDIAELNTDGTIDMFPAQIIAIFKTVTGVVDTTLMEFYESYMKMPIKTTIYKRTTPFGELIYFSNECRRCDYQLVNGCFGMVAINVDNSTAFLTPFVGVNGRLICQDGSSAYIESFDKNGVLYDTNVGNVMWQILMICETASSFTKVITDFNKLKKCKSDVLGENIAYMASHEDIEKWEKDISEQNADG